MEIRSYRRVFDLERRIYRVDGLRLNPSGIPVRGVVYFIAITAAAVVAGRLPLVAVLAGAVPWYLRDLVLPGVGAAVLTVIRVEGRPFHLAAHALVRHGSRRHDLVGVCPRQACSLPGGRWYPDEVLMLPDGSDSRLRRLRYSGPGAVLIAVAHERAVRGAGMFDLPGHRPRLTVRESQTAPAPADAEVIVLEGAVRLQVR
jgi:hypothetical protein